MSILVKIKSFLTGDYFKISLLAAFIFWIIYPLSNSINFYQNDDWIYYKTIQQFLTGDYVMPGYIEALFYTQGFLGTVYAYLFGLDKLPVLTLIISILTFYIFAITIRKHYLNNFKDTALVSIMLLISPLYIYSTLGFMSDMYFLFFVAISIFFIEEFLKEYKYKDFIFLNLAIVIGFFVRQLSIIVGFAFFLILLFKRKYKWAIAQLISSVSLFLAYLYLVPKTRTMEKHQNLLFENLLNPSYIFTTTYVGVIYAIMTILPLTILIISKFIKTRPGLLKSGLFILSSLVVYFLFSYLFNPSNTTNPNFYYLKNTVDKKGFFTGTSLGQKYGLMYEQEIYYYFELITKITLAFFITSIIFYIKRSLNFYSIFIILYLGFMTVLGGGLYDRYYLTLIPVAILFILNLAKEFNYITRFLSVISILIVSFYSYNFAMEFVILNNNIWDTSKEVSQKTDTSYKRIQAGNAWNRTYYNDKFDKYRFSFEKRETDPEIKCCFKLYDTVEVNFVFNMFNDSKIYLYKRDY